MHWCKNDVLQVDDYNLNLLQTFSSLGQTLQSFAASCAPDHQVRIFWEALTPYFLGQGINYRTVANQFGVAVPTVCRIVHAEDTKAIGDNLNHECVKFSESDAVNLDSLATFLGKHIPNPVGAIDGSHIVISCAPPNADWFIQSYGILLPSLATQVRKGLTF